MFQYPRWPGRGPGGQAWVTTILLPLLVSPAEVPIKTTATMCIYPRPALRAVKLWLLRAPTPAAAAAVCYAHCIGLSFIIPGEPLQQPFDSCKPASQL
jgi:hypothetical protein